MIETSNTTGTRSTAIHAGRNGRAGQDTHKDTHEDTHEQRAHADYYRAYYRALVEENASRSEGRRGLEAIKMQRRRARRERWLQGIKSLAGVLSHHGAEAAS
jgi:hypothetical protein